MALEGEKLAKARLYQTPSWGQKELASKLGVDTSSVGRWEANNSIPKGRVGALCDALGITEEWLTNGDDSLPPFLTNGIPTEGMEIVSEEEKTSQDEALTQGGMIRLPVWQGVAAGSPMQEDYFEEEGYPELVELNRLLITDLKRTHVIANVRGNSMAPRIADRERVILKMDPDAPTGVLVGAESPEGRRFIKKHVRGKSGFRELHSINSKYDPIVEIDGWRILGGVIAILKDPEPGMPNLEYDFGNYLRNGKE